MTLFEGVLVAVDGSENSMRAADLAIDIAKKSGAHLYVLSVVPTPVYAATGVQGAVGSGAVAQGLLDRSRKEAEGFVGVVVAKAQAEGLRVRGEITENVPSVVEAISDYAQEWRVGLIVVGTRGLSGFRKLVLGSVSAALVAHAPCSVLVVR